MSSLRTTSICDTTPLQRFESTSSSSEEPSSPTAASIIAAANSLKAETAATTTTAKVSLLPSADSHSNSNNNNNNNNSIKTVTLQLPNFTNNGSNSKVNKMYTKDILQILKRILMDICILACVGLPLLGLTNWAVPNKRGFFCNDESLKHPYKESTVRSWVLYAVCIGTPTALIVLIEFYRANDKKIQNYTNCDQTQYSIYRLVLPNWLIECYKKIGIFIFGCFVEQLTTEIAKFSIGRLRPHFFQICQPILDNGTCSDPMNAQRYIVNYKCANVPDVTPKMLKDVNLSFPSGHASFTFFTMIYIAIYLQKRMQWSHTKMLKHLLQFLFLMFAWYTSLTRVSDYKHHWTDVLAGAGIGLTYGIIATSTLW